MTISLVMGPKRPHRDHRRLTPAQRPDSWDANPDPSDSGFDDPAGGDPSKRTDPSMLPPENDLALARMLGCSMLVGLLCIVGLLMLVF